MQRVGTRAGSAIALLCLVAASAMLGTRAIEAGYWIDEGISVGIAGHPVGEIPGLLRQDGAPPLYYVLLSAWMSVFGGGETATHFLSLLAALATIPAALWAGRTLFGTRAGWAAAAIAATAPTFTAYAQETRMYSLLVLLSVLLAGTFVRAFVHGRRRALVAFVALAVALVYTHNWGLYMLLGLAGALPVAARHRGGGAVARDAAVAAAAIAAAYAPWIPTLIHQAEHTGAPWSAIPDLGDVLKPVAVPLGEGIAATIVIGTAAVGIARHARQARGSADGPRASATALAIALGVAGMAAWTVAQVEPGWADRYMTVFAGPVILLAGAGLGAAGRAGVAVLAGAVLVWAVQPAPGEKSNAHAVASALERGDLAVVAHPEQMATLRHYAPGGVRWATVLGPVADARLFDWRDAPQRLREADPRRTLRTLLAAHPGAERLVLIVPAGLTRGGPEWIDLVARRSAEWAATTDRHPRLRRTAALPPRGESRHATDVRAIVYRLREP
jgi:mannosyltransferase